jgi:hypothetical protein
MPSSGMLRRVVLVRTDVSEELSVSIVRVIRIGDLGTLAVTSSPSTLRRKLLKRAKWNRETDHTYPPITSGIPTSEIIIINTVVSIYITLANFARFGSSWQWV